MDTLVLVPAVTANNDVSSSPNVRSLKSLGIHTVVLVIINKLPNGLQLITGRKICHEVLKEVETRKWIASPTPLQ